MAQSCKIIKGKKNDLTDEEALEFLKKTEDIIKRIDGIRIPDVDNLLDA